MCIRDRGEALESMKKPDGTALSADVAREVCERENYQVLLSGSLVRVGSEFLLSVEATSCATGQSIAAGKIRVSNESEVLEMCIRDRFHFTLPLAKPANAAA